MTTTTDTFARFVDVLAETLDDHGLSGAALAARLHVSRFHFDPLVSARGSRRRGPRSSRRFGRSSRSGRLDETFVDAICDPPEVFTYGGMIAHVLTFGAHRRTLVLGALSDAGVKDLGAGDPMRWLAEPV